MEKPNNTRRHIHETRKTTHRTKPQSKIQKIQINTATPRIPSRQRTKTAGNS